MSVQSETPVCEHMGICFITVNETRFGCGETYENTTKAEFPLNYRVHVSDDLTELVKDLSPTSQARTILLLQSLRKNEAVIGVDDQKRPVIQYKDDRSRKLWWDASNANILTKPRSDDDVQVKMDACLEMIDYLKKHKAPSGVVLDPTHVSSKAGYYREGREFTKTKDVLGKGNSAGDIIVIKDKTTQTESAHKTMMISYFREEEIRAWVDLNETGIPPALYCFKLEGNKIHIFMEKIDRGITLRDIIDTHMAVHSMHQKGWTHKDLHPGNVMLQESEGVIQTRIIDFGLAKPMDSEDGPRGFRSDMAEVVRKFTALYIDEEFDSETDFRKNWKDKVQQMANMYAMSKEDKVELFSLIDSALQVVSMSDVPRLQQELAAKMNFDPQSLSKQVAKILFAKPEFPSVHPDSQDLETELQKIKLVMGASKNTGHSTMDQADSGDFIMDDDDGYFTTEEVNDDFLDNLRKQTGLGW
ncbi:unnamed protein product [Mytilus edulis]|uniref:Protein kinase domain-containing protein n=1 Tax=Mytilus edulis TaxID=6550 RepID=A0A8S3VK10_MYTED|nr:unnamed protein product [Mytilus edulis]